MNKSVAIGSRFNRLVVLSRDNERSTPKRSYWHCLCDCGNTKSVRNDGLTSGSTQSCGCLGKEHRAKSPKRIDPFYKKLCDSRGVSDIKQVPEYNVWRGLKRRGKPGKVVGVNECYAHVTVCKRWDESFQAFYEDMGPRPSARHQVDRISNKRGYSPENCRWSTIVENSRNKSDNRPICWNGEVKLLCEWEEELMPKLGIKRGALWARLTQYGWSIERAFTTPHQKCGKSNNPKCDESDLANLNE
jgi:hypothetical protein